LQNISTANLASSSTTISCLEKANFATIA